MIIFLCIFGYFVLGLLSYFLVNFVGGYRKYDNDTTSILSVLSILFWPLLIPIILVHSYVCVAADWFGEWGDRVRERAIERRRQRERDHSDEIEEVQESDTYREGRIVKKKSPSRNHIWPFN